MWQKREAYIFFFYIYMDNFAGKVYYSDRVALVKQLIVKKKKIKTASRNTLHFPFNRFRTTPLTFTAAGRPRVQKITYLYTV